MSGRHSSTSARHSFEGKFDSCRSSTKGNDDSLEDEVDDKGVVKRKSRNLSEKKRRDQFNLLINELCSMVCTGKRKADKSTILKSAISFIQNHNQVAMQSQSSEMPEDWKPSFLSNEEFTHLMLEAFDGFIMVMSVTGKILYVSENITSLLGHIPAELIGSNISNLVVDEEREHMKMLLRSWATREAEHAFAGRENPISFGCHLRRGGRSRDSEAAQPFDYELVIFSGYYRNQGTAEGTGSRSSISSWADENRSTASDALSQHSGLVFVGSGTLQTPQLVVEMSLVDVSKSEFTSRHSLEWKFLFLDHRAPPIIGYLPFEVLGTSGYDYYHVDDLERVSACHEALMQKGEGTSCCYRFLTKGQQWIWLQTRYYITYHQWNSKPEFVVCSHRVVSYSEVVGHQPKESTGVRSGSVSPSDSSADAIAVLSCPPKARGREKSNNHKNKTSDRNETELTSKTSSTGKSAGREKSRSSMKTSSSGHNGAAAKSSRSTPVDTLLPPPAAPATAVPVMSDSHSTQFVRQSSSSLRAGSGGGGSSVMSDGASVSSSSSFQSAASQHSRMSDQSMQSLQSAQSHHSLQSAESYHSGKMMQQQRYPTVVAAELYTQLRSGSRRSHSTPVEVSSASASEGSHHFLQPNPVAALRRSPSQAVAGTAEAFAYPSVVPLGVDAATVQGVTLPVQRVLEGLPVVTLPGIVAHEPVTMTTAQRQLHEQLVQKHALLQRQILAQQDELRKVSEQLLLAQYGTWSPTVLKMTVPLTDAGDSIPVSSGGLSQQAHAVLSAGGLVTCLTAAPSVTVGQGHVSTAATSLTFTPTAPLIVQNDPSQVLLRAATAQETLVQLSQQEVQMLLTQTLLQDPSSSTGDYS